MIPPPYHAHEDDKSKNKAKLSKHRHYRLGKQLLIDPTAGVQILRRSLGDTWKAVSGRELS